MKPGEEPVSQHGSSGAPVPDLREEVDPTKREAMAGWAKRGLATVCMAFGVFQFYTAGARPMLGVVHYAIHLAFALTIVLWAYPLRRSAPRRIVPLYDFVCIGIVVVAAAYVVGNGLPIMDFSYVESSLDLILGISLLVLVLEASRRSLGWIFPVLVSLSILYALF